MRGPYDPPTAVDPLRMVNAGFGQLVKLMKHITG
jgi:hypothetical protein